MKEGIEDYLKRLKSYEYTEEQLESVKEFRENAEYMDFEMFTELHVNQRLVKRTIKLRKPRNLYVMSERIYYLNHYHKAYCECGYFFTEFYLKSRAEKELEERNKIEQVRAEKKKLKPKEIEVVVKPKRKRINA